MLIKTALKKLDHAAALINELKKDIKYFVELPFTFEVPYHTRGFTTFWYVR